jgi:UDP-glucose 4-epimerase
VSGWKPEVVVHTGALVDLSRDYTVGKKCFDVNTIGTMNLLEALKHNKPTIFVYISTEEVYGNGPIPFNEGQRVDPPSPYAISKVAAEQLCSWYGKEYSFPVVIVRLGNFYGPEQPTTKYFAQIIVKALKNEPIPCNSGMKKRDYLYVDDAVELIVKTFTSDTHTIINATGGMSYRLLDIIEIIKRLTNSSSDVQIGAIPDRITERDEWLADISLAKKLYGWEPKTGLDEGLKRTIEYFRTLK